MRVCHVCSNYDRFFVNLMEEQISRGIELRVFYFRAKERGWPDVKSSYVDVRLNYRNWHRPFFHLKEKFVLEDFFKLYKNKKFDIVHAHTLFSNGYVALQIKKRLGIPYIVAVRDVDVNVFLKYRITLRNLGMEILKQAEKVVFLSPEYRNFVLSKYVSKDLRRRLLEKSVIIPNGVENFFLENKKIRHNLHMDKPIQIITVGYVCKRKNQLTVAKAIDKLNKSGIKANYTVIGKVLDNGVFNKLKKYSFVSYIPFSPKEKLIEYYRQSDIYVMPSLTETFGITYAEAMTQGLPVIYSKGQGFDGQFKDGEVGYSVKSLDIEDINNKIIKIIDNYQMLTRNCIKLCDKFNWIKITDEYLKIYYSIYNNR